MSQQTKAGESIFFWCTVLTMVGSICALSMEFLVFLGVGFEESIVVLLVTTLLSTIGLLTGTVALLSHRRWARAVLFVSSIYIPVAFPISTVRGVVLPLLWWLLFLLGTVEVVFALLGPRLAYIEDSSD
jgi:hypothetical protein